MTHLDDTDLLDLALGTGQHPHLAACRGCDAALVDVREAVHRLALALTPVAPPPRLHVRLRAAVEGPAARRSPRVAALLGLPPGRVTAALAQVDAGTAPWAPVLPGIELYPLPAADGRERGLIRAAAGVTFPYHRHRGEERVVVLQGACRDSGGRELGPGDEIEHGAGTGHHLEIHPGPALVFAFVSDGSDFAAP